MNRLELGGSLNNLTQVIEERTEPDLADLRAIIEFGNKIPLADGKFIKKHSTKKGGNTVATGHTNEAGDLSVSVDDSEETFETSGRPTERVSYFVLHRMANKIYGILFFQHWKELFHNQAALLDDEETALREQNVYLIIYYLESLEPVSIGKQVLYSFRYTPLPLFDFLELWLKKLFYKITNFLTNSGMEEQITYSTTKSEIKIDVTWRAK